MGAVALQIIAAPQSTIAPPSNRVRCTRSARTPKGRLAAAATSYVTVTSSPTSVLLMWRSCLSWIADAPTVAESALASASTDASRRITRVRSLPPRAVVTAFEPARASRPDWSITGPLRGDSFVSGGLVYLGGSIPDGDTTATFTPGDEGRLGSLVVRGQYIADGAEIASGARHSVASTHIFMLDEGSGVVTEGLEGNGSEVRAVVGGYGKYSGATGQVTQDVVGSNGSAGPNLRFTFTLKVASGQEPSELMQKRAIPRRR